MKWIWQAPDDDGRHVHHHGILAGVGAGAMAVLMTFGLVLMAWHRVSGYVGDALIVIALTAAACVVGGAVAAGVYAVLWLRHRIRHPETLSRHPVRAEVLEEPPTAIEADRPAAIEPARVYLNVTPDQLAAIMRRHAEE